jgi:16S rRNA (guanine966-N2)-methyltransferase
MSRLGTFEELRVADLFAGSGALGFEALSRGAAHATFVERDAQAASTIRRNADRLLALPRCKVIGESALALPRADPFDLVFADPPYQPGSGTAAVQAVIAAEWLAPGGWMSVETGRGEPVDPVPLTFDTQRDVGAARLTLLRRS